MSRLEVLTPDTWADFVKSPWAVLVLGKSDCDACQQWSTELESSVDDSFFPDVRFGKLLLDQRGLGDFKKTYDWIKDLDVLPHNVIFRNGEEMKSFAGHGLDRLRNRLERLHSA